MMCIARLVGSLALVVALAGCTPQVAFHVPDMMCEEGCAAKVREVLAETPGVKQVRIDFDQRMATVVVDKTVFDSDAAIKELVDCGFDNSTLAITR